MRRPNRTEKAPAAPAATGTSRTVAERTAQTGFAPSAETSLKAQDGSKPSHAVAAQKPPATPSSTQISLPGRGLRPPASATRMRCGSCPPRKKAAQEQRAARPDNKWQGHPPEPGAKDARLLQSARMLS